MRPPFPPPSPRRKPGSTDDLGVNQPLVAPRHSPDWATEHAFIGSALVSAPMSLFGPIFTALNEAQVRYVVVGGVAMVLHGHARLTVDLDLVVDLEDQAAARAIDALIGIGLRARAPVDPRGFADSAIRNAWIRDRAMQVFSLSDPANPMRAIDLFVTYPIAFEDLWTRSQVFEIQGAPVHAASIEDLIHLKRLAGREQDKADIRELEAILELKRGSQ